MMPPRVGPLRAQEEKIEKQEVLCIDGDIVCDQCGKQAQGYMVDRVCGHTFHIDCYETAHSVSELCYECSAPTLEKSALKRHWNAVFH